VSFAKLNEAVESWAIEDHFTFLVVKKEVKRVDYHCRARAKGCLWTVFASTKMVLGIWEKRSFSHLFLYTLGLPYLHPVKLTPPSGPGVGTARRLEMAS